VFSVCSGILPWRCPSAESGTFQGFIAVTQPHTMQDFVLAPLSPLWGVSQEDATAHAEGSCSLHGRISVPGTPSLHSGASSLVSGSGGPSGTDFSARSTSWRSYSSPSAEHILTWTWPRGFSPALIHLLRGCLAVRPQERFSMQQVKSHPWFENPRWVPPPQRHYGRQGGTASVKAPCRLQQSHSRQVRPAAAVASHRQGPRDRTPLGAAATSAQPGAAAAVVFHAGCGTASIAGSSSGSSARSKPAWHAQEAPSAVATSCSLSTCGEGYTTSLPSATEGTDPSLAPDMTPHMGPFGALRPLFSGRGGIAANARVSSQHLWVDATMHSPAMGASATLSGSVNGASPNALGGDGAPRPSKVKRSSWATGVAPGETADVSSKHWHSPCSSQRRISTNTTIAEQVPAPCSVGGGCSSAGCGVCGGGR